MIEEVDEEIGCPHCQGHVDDVEMTDLCSDCQDAMKAEYENREDIIYDRR